MSKSTQKSYRPGFESLEDRSLMTATLFNNVVTIEGTNSKDVVKVTIEPAARVAQRSAGNLPGAVVNLNHLVVRENGRVTGRFNLSGIRLIEFYGFDGHDTFKNMTGIRSYAEGGAGNDKLIGGANTDEFYGGIGNDALLGNGGMDYLFGEANSDRLDGGFDGWADELWGGANADTFVREPMGVSIYGGPNRDAPMDFNLFEGDQLEGLILEATTGQASSRL